MPLIPRQVNLIQPEPDVRRRNTFGPSHIPGVHQIRMDHDHSDHRPKEWIAAEYLRRAERDQNRQKYEGRIGKQVNDRIGT